jgi:hypothetical protein
MVCRAREYGLLRIDGCLNRDSRAAMCRMRRLGEPGAAEAFEQPKKTEKGKKGGQGKK